MCSVKQCVECGEIMSQPSIDIFFPIFGYVMLCHFFGKEVLRNLSELALKLQMVENPWSKDDRRKIKLIHMSWEQL